MCIYFITYYSLLVRFRCNMHVRQLNWQRRVGSPHTSGTWVVNCSQQSTYTHTHNIFAFGMQCAFGKCLPSWQRGRLTNNFTNVIQLIHTYTNTHVHSNATRLHTSERLTTCTTCLIIRSEAPPPRTLCRSGFNKAPDEFYAVVVDFSGACLASPHLTSPRLHLAGNVHSICTMFHVPFGRIMPTSL